MNTKVKICGIKTQGEIDIINKYPVDYIGFILTPSKRQIDANKAYELKNNLREDIKTVGVFMNEGLDYIQMSVKTIGLDAVQLHGDYSKEQVLEIKQKLGVEVFKTVPIYDEVSILKAYDYKKVADRVLLDTKVGSQTGGTGQTFDWELVNKLDFKNEIILAGGLNPENIKEAIEKVRPFMVDLNSGLETQLIKDEMKIQKAFRKMGKLL